MRKSEKQCRCQKRIEKINKTICFSKKNNQFSPICENSSIIKRCWKLDCKREPGEENEGREEAKRRRGRRRGV
jgi:hypothetical protein